MTKMKITYKNIYEKPYLYKIFFLHFENLLIFILSMPKFAFAVLLNWRDQFGHKQREVYIFTQMCSQAKLKFFKGKFSVALSSDFTLCNTSYKIDLEYPQKFSKIFHFVKFLI